MKRNHTEQKAASAAYIRSRYKGSTTGFISGVLVDHVSAVREGNKFGSVKSQAQQGREAKKRRNMRKRSPKN
jgi:hypothetical protein